ncbi:MAG: sigma-54-dependent Fis family transcriptional regulator [bacterium]|nr:sigma-54-dependent Fis family transcriptional regulator [bacterium]
MTRALVVEDDPRIRANLVYQLGRQQIEVTAVGDAETAVVELRKERPDLLLLDVRLPGMSGVDLVRLLVTKDELPATIIVSGEASISETVEALRLGVHDFIEKPFSSERLEQSVRNTLDHASLRRQVALLESELAGDTTLLGSSKKMDELRRRIAQAAPTDGRVLIRGESGTGKELVANAIHRGSSRSEQAFIKINCAAIPTHLIEDELFGHVRGAFTDAKSAKAGLFEEADGGTLFLDEIGDMDPTLQSRLLRVLEDGRVRRIGDTRDQDVDVRVIAATHTNLEAAISERAFREDLYFRLAHLPIEVPALRERRDDIQPLFDHFIEHYWKRHRMRSRGVDEDVYGMLETYDWPGNVRELKALCERLVVFGGDPITVDQLPAEFSNTESRLLVASSSEDEGEEIVTLRTFKARAERHYIERVLKETGGNVSAAARLLDVQRTHLHQRMVVLDVDRSGDSD